MNKTNENTDTETTTTTAETSKSRASKNSKETYGAKGRTNLLMFDPDDVVIVTDKANPLYDERADLAVDEAMVKNLLAVGQIKPITVRKNPETQDTEVVVGRQLTKAMRRANEILRERGEMPMMLSATIKRSDNGTLAGIVASENAIRQAETPLTISKKMERILSHGKTEDDLQVYFGMSKQMVKNYLCLLECTAVVRNAVESGKLTVTHAMALSKLNADQQRDTVEKMILAQASEGGGKHQQAKRAREVAEASGAVVARVRGKKDIAAFRARIDEKCDPEFKAFVLHVLDWVVGGREPRVPQAKKTNKANVA